MKQIFKLYLLAIFAFASNFANAQCMGITGTVPMSFTSTTLVSGLATPTPNVTPTSVWKFAHVATTPVDIDAIVTLTSYTTSGPDSSKISWNTVDLPYTTSTTGVDAFFQPSLITAAGTYASLTNPTICSTTFNIQFVLTGTSTPYFQNLLANAIDIDGGNPNLLRETVTYSPDPTALQVGTGSLLTLSGSTFTGPTQNQTGIGTAQAYNGYAYYYNASNFNITNRDSIWYNGSVGASARNHSVGFGCQYPSSIDFVTAGISGTVFNDVNGMTNSLVDGTGINNPSSNQLYVNLLDASGNVIATTAVAADGTYSFNGVKINTGYTVQLTTNQGVLGSAAPSTVLPAGWVNTGETTIAGGNETGSAINSNLSVTTGASGNTPTNNFGIQQAPTAVTSSNTAIANAHKPITLTSAFTGTDPSVGGNVDSFRIQFPTSGAESITINGTTYTASSFATTFPSGFVSVLASTAIIAATPTLGTLTSIVIPYQTVDNGGATSPVATVTQPFNAVLSIKYLSFNAKIEGKSIKLNFNTAGNAVNSIFIIERSGNGIDFNQIGRISGTSSTIYEFIDMSPIANLSNFYRIKEVDALGKIAYSNVVLIKLSKDSKIDVYPIPANNNLNLVLNEALQNKTIEINIINAIGQTVLNKKINSANINETLDVSKLSEGLYKLKITSNNQVISLSNIVINR